MTIDLPTSYKPSQVHAALVWAQHCHKFFARTPEDSADAVAAVTIIQAVYRGLGGEVPAGESPYRLERY